MLCEAYTVVSDTVSKLLIKFLLCTMDTVLRFCFYAFAILQWWGLRRHVFRLFLLFVCLFVHSFIRIVTMISLEWLDQS